MGKMIEFKRPDGQSVQGYLAEPASGASGAIPTTPGPRQDPAPRSHVMLNCCPRATPATGFITSGNWP